jgi:hypothetical protein
LKRRICHGVVLIGLALAPAGCDYSSSEPPPITGDTSLDTSASEPAEANAETKAIILDTVVHLIQNAAIKPGGDNFRQATAKLNNYFEGTSPSEYALKPAARKYVNSQLLPQGVVQSLERRSFEMPDARHLEDCMLYHGIATRIGGNGDDLTRVRRVFDWIVRQVQLVPENSLAAPSIGQAQARPYDVLLRGMATETAGGWSERGWLFMSLCRQLGVDAGLLFYTPPGQKQATPWICTALIDQKLYLFDPRIGLPIPGPDGTGVATLDEALSNPVVLERLDLPGQTAYGTDRATLLNSPTKIGVFLDSSPGYLAPRMRLLQNSLVGKDRTILFRDPAEQRDSFAKALGSHAGEIALWQLPVFVEISLFNDPKFVEATQKSLSLFTPQLPLLYARIKQLRGEMPDAIADYVNLRFHPNPMLVGTKDIPIPTDQRRALDQYATYFLGLCHLEQGNSDQAEFFFKQTLRMLPAPGPGQPTYNMFRWGAQANLARLSEARQKWDTAIAYYTAGEPTPQRHGNHFVARELVWRNPTAPPHAPLPPAPPPIDVDVPLPQAAANP